MQFYAVPLRLVKTEIKVIELRNYLAFYGYENSDVIIFSKYTQELFEASKTAADTYISMQELNKEKQILEKEIIYNNIKANYQSAKFELEPKQRYDVYKYKMLERELVPLFIASEKNKKEEEKNAIEKLGDFVPYEEKIQHNSHLHSMERKGRNIKHLRMRSLPVRNKLGFWTPSFFSRSMLQVIFSFVDYHITKQKEVCPFSVIGDFAVVILQVHASEIEEIHRKMGEKIFFENNSFRILRLYKDFYRILVRVVLIYGIQEFQTIAFQDFHDAIKSHFGTYWNTELSRPAESFYFWAKELSRRYDNEGMDCFFGRLSRMMHTYWEKEIVTKSFNFK